MVFVEHHRQSSRATMLWSQWQILSLSKSRYTIYCVLEYMVYFLLWQKKRNHEAFSTTNFETFWCLGKPVQGNFSRLVYLGAHGSDSGLTCIVPEDPFSDDLVEPVDWTEFVLSTLDATEGDKDALEEYQLYKFFGKIPDEGVEAAVYGVPSEEDSGSFETIVIRALETVPDEPESIDK